MTQIQKFKKPELARISETKKLREYTSEERLTLCTKIVEKLLVDLAVGKNADTEHHIRAIQFMHQTCGKWTPEQIMKAFDMYINREFGHKEIFQQLNKVVIGDVMHHFDNFNKEKLAEYKRQIQRQKIESMKPTQKEIDFIMMEAIDRIHKDFLQNKRITESCHHVYDHLFEQGFLPNDIEYKKQKFEEAKEIRMEELLEERMSNPSEHKSITEQIKNIQKDSQLKNIAKRLVLEEYFKNIKNK